MTLAVDPHREIDEDSLHAMKGCHQMTHCQMNALPVRSLLVYTFPQEGGA